MLIAFNLSSSVSAGAPTSTLGAQEIGAIVSFEVEGELLDFIVVHQGSPSTDYVGFEEGTVLMMLDVLQERRWHSEVSTDYENSDVHLWLNTEFANKIEPNIRIRLSQVQVPYRPGGELNDSNIAFGGNGLGCRLFLPAAYEIGMSGSTPTPQMGSVFAYFAGIDYNQTTAGRSAKRGGVPVMWWTRSPFVNIPVSIVFHVEPNGAFNSTTLTTHVMRGVRPVLVLPDNIAVADDGRLLPTVTIQPPDDDSVFTPELAAMLHDYIVFNVLALVVALILVICFLLYKFFGFIL
jgi:hypothetical protein